MSTLETKMPITVKETENGFVRIKYRIDKLKATNSTPPKAKNADIKTPQFNERSFWVMIEGKQEGALKSKVFLPHIVQLPYEITPSDCKCTAEDDDVFVWLKKKDTDQPWESEIRSKKLETADSSEIEAFLETVYGPTKVGGN